jgi:hypothetical protein
MALQKIGALWKKKAKDSGNPYLSGTIEIVAGFKQYVTVLPYTVKEGTQKNANSPDYNILLNIEDKESKTENKEVAKEDFA